MSLALYSELAAEVYDLDKPVGHSFGDVEFYRERLESCSGHILEPAVGTGRVLIPLLEAGFVVDGFDNSPQMLAVCRARCSERGLDPALYEGSMQSLSLREKYEVVIVPAGSFCLLEERRDSLEALRCFYNLLTPGGRLIVDLELQTDFDLNAVSTRTWRTPRNDTITLESKLVEVNFFDQYTVSHLRYEKWRSGELLQTELQRFALRWYGVEEFKLVLMSVGFSDIVISSDYEHGRPPSSAEQTFTFEARRA